MVRVWDVQLRWGGPSRTKQLCELLAGNLCSGSGSAALISTTYLLFPASVMRLRFSSRRRNLALFFITLQKPAPVVYSSWGLLSVDANFLRRKEQDILDRIVHGAETGHDIGCSAN